MILYFNLNSFVMSDEHDAMSTSADDTLSDSFAAMSLDSMHAPSCSAGSTTITDNPEDGPPPARV